MNRLEHRIERDLRQIADRATPSPDAWNSILTRIADQEPETETEIIMLTEAQTPARRWLPLAAAAVLIVIAVTGIAFAISRNDESPSPAATTLAPTTVAPATTVAPTTVAPTTVAPTTTVEPTETVGFAVETANDMPVAFTAPADWTVSDGWGAYKAGEAGLLFDQVGNIYADGCQWVQFDPPVGPTVDDLAGAWANVPGFAATPPIDVTVDGYVGKQIEFTVPDFATTGNAGGPGAIDCMRLSFALQYPGEPVPGNPVDPGFWAQGPNQHTQQRILDVDGIRLVITSWYLPSTTPEDRAALEEALASIQIG